MKCTITKFKLAVLTSHHENRICRLSVNSETWYQLINQLLRPGVLYTDHI